MSRNPILLASLSLLILLFAVPALPQEIEETPLKWKQVALGDGEALYVELCAACHGVDARGDGPAAPALAKPVPDLTRLAASHDGTFPAEEVEQAITGQRRIVVHGTVDMPVWGQRFQEVRPDLKPSHREGFARLRIHHLVTYLESIQVE